MTKKYRIDRAYGKVYIWNENANFSTNDAYFFLCTFNQINADHDDSDKAIFEKIKIWEEQY